MTNQQIIFNESMELMKAGTIGTTGRSFTMETDDGEKITVQEPEQIHTYARWKALGRQVKKGEKAVAQFVIWKQGKPSKKAQEEAEKNGETPKTKMFMKKASFFTEAQTEPIEKKATA